jgi:hypothetical protein
MGFLDDLKRQADALKTQQGSDSAALARNAALTEAACKSAFNYFHTLRDQLDVLQPANPARFTLDRQHVFTGLRLSDFRIDARRKPLRDQEVHDFIVLRQLELTKDFLPDIEKLEPRLRQSGAEVESHALRNPDNGKLLGMRYRFVADFRGSIRITPDHDTARMHFQLHNLDGFESISVAFPALEVGSTRLDELARWLAGAPHAFLKDGQALRRIEA